MYKSSYTSFQWHLVTPGFKFVLQYAETYQENVAALLNAFFVTAIIAPNMSSPYT